MDKSRRHDKAAVGRLRQRLARILLHSSCTTTTSPTAFVGLATTNAAVAATPLEEPQPPPTGRTYEPRSTLTTSGRRRHRRGSAGAPLVHISIDCSARSVGAAVLPSPPTPAKDRGSVTTSRTRKGGGDKARVPSYGWSSSTDTGDDELAPFGSDVERGDEEADTRSSTLFSSRSFSSDSTSDFYYYSTTTGAGAGPKRYKHPPPRREPPRRLLSKPAGAFWPAANNKHVVKARSKTKDDDKDGGAAAGSTAVVKRSHDPYADFRSSMVEMVAGQRIRGADALGELLVRYLSLNSPRHHPAILAAFEDVWESVMGNDP